MSKQSRFNRIECRGCQCLFKVECLPSGLGEFVWKTRFCWGIDEGETTRETTIFAAWTIVKFFHTRIHGWYAGSCTVTNIRRNILRITCIILSNHYDQITVNQHQTAPPAGPNVHVGGKLCSAEYGMRYDTLMSISLILFICLVSCALALPCID